MDSSLGFTTNNCRGLATSRIKRLKIFLHLKNEINNLGFIFLQETHSSPALAKEFKEDFGKDNALYLCHGASNARGVAIGFCGTFNYKVKKEIADPNGRYLIMHITLGDTNYILTNIYNENEEKDQLVLLDEVETQIDSLGLCLEGDVIMAGDFNFYFDKKLDAIGGNPKTKNKSIAKFLHMKEKYDLVDIWRVRNKNKKRYTFRQNHYSGHLQRRLDYIFIPNHLQASVDKVDIKVAICTDHSPVYMNICVDESLIPKGCGFWKFNASLTKDAAYVTGINDLISNFFDTNTFENKQLQWELLKYEIKQFSRKFSMQKAKQKKEQKDKLEKKLDELNNMSADQENDEYKITTDALEKIYHEEAIGLRIRSKCDWYELGEKSNKYFLNLEKRNAKTSTITKLTDNDKIVTNQKDILKDIELYYKNLFTNNNTNTPTTCRNFLETLDTPQLTNDDQNALSADITIDKLHNTLTQMADCKSPGSDGLSCKFYKHFWEK